MIDHYDVIIIGTDAGGGTLAYKLAGSGKRILLLERGDFLPREKENWDATAVFAKKQIHDDGTLVRQQGETILARTALLCGRQYQILWCRTFPSETPGLWRDQA